MKSFWKTLLLSVVIVNLFAAGGIYIYRVSLKKRLGEWTIKQVLERGRGELPPGFLAEALELSQDKPLPWDLFNTKQAERKLEKYPFFKRVNVRKIEPNAALVDYVLRTPLAKVADFSNRALDEEGVVFPLEPFYSPKKLPSIRFGRAVSQEETKEAFALMRSIKEVAGAPRILLIDLADKKNPALGKQKIVVVVEEQLFRDNKIKKQPVLLELSAVDPLEGIERWKALRSLIIKEDNYKDNIKMKGVIVDLRQPGLAYLH